MSPPTPRALPPLGLDPTDYDRQVLEITSEITRQVFPFTLDLEHPRFVAGLERLRRISEASDRAGDGVVGRIKKAALGVGAAATFAGLFLVPTKKNAIPDSVRLSPAW